MGESITFMDDKPVDRFGMVPLLVPALWERAGMAYTSNYLGEPFEQAVDVFAQFTPHHADCPPVVYVNAHHSNFSFSGRFDPEQARLLAAALLKAADVVEPIRLKWKSIVQGEVQPCSSL